MTLHIVAAETEAALERFKASLGACDGSTHTVDSYVSDVRRFATWFHERRPTAPLVTETMMVDVRAYRDHMVDVLRRKPATVNRHLLSLRRFFGVMCDAGAIRDNPATDVRSVRAPKRMQPLGLTDAEVQRLLVAAGKSSHGQGPRNYALVQLMLQAGLRVQEVVGLVGEDLEVHPRSGTVRVRSGKGLRERVVPLNAAARRALERYFEVRGRPQPAEAVFLSARRGPLAKRTAQHAVEQCARRAGIDRLSVGAHTLRHTFALRFLGANPGDLVGLAALMGHETIETTAVYVRPSAADLAARVERTLS